MKGLCKLANLGVFGVLIFSSMLFYSKGFALGALFLLILAVIHIAFVLKRIDAEKETLKNKIITFSNSYNIKPHYFLYDVNLSKVIAVDTNKDKVVVFENSKLTIHDLSIFSGADVECGKMSQVIFYRKSSVLPALLLNIRKGQCDAYHSYIQTIFGH